MNKHELKLKTAAEEIKDILKKHNIAGAVVLHSAEGGEGYGEFFSHIHTKYSCAYQYEEDQVRFYSKSKDYKSKEEQIEKQANTANMLNMLIQGSGKNFMFLDHINKAFEGVVEVQHEKTKWK